MEGGQEEDKGEEKEEFFCILFFDKLFHKIKHYNTNNDNDNDNDNYDDEQEEEGEEKEESWCILSIDNFVSQNKSLQNHT